MYGLRSGVQGLRSRSLSMPALPTTVQDFTWMTFVVASCMTRSFGYAMCLDFQDERNGGRGTGDQEPGCCRRSARTGTASASVPVGDREQKVTVSHGRRQGEIFNEQLRRGAPLRRPDRGPQQQEPGRRLGAVHRRGVGLVPVRSEAGRVRPAPGRVTVMATDASDGGRTSAGASVRPAAG